MILVKLINDFCINRDNYFSILFCKSILYCIIKLSVTDSKEKEITDKENVALINSFRYRSYYYDKETEMYYLNSRYYNPDMGRFINADGLIGTAETNINYNLYTYTSNNPINLVDGDGDYALAAAAGCPSAVLVAVTALLIYAGIQAVAPVIASGVSNITIPKANTSSKNQKNKSTKKHTVYTLRDSSGVAIYVGRTTNVKQRANSHRRNPERMDLIMQIEKFGLTKEEARGFEQALILACRTHKNGEIGSNKIYGIRWDNPYYDYFMNLATNSLDENETFVGHCNAIK